MLYVGIGFSYVNLLLIFINLFVVVENILKVREREIGLVIEKVVKEFCEIVL